MALACSQGWELMTSMGECYGSSTRHVNTDYFMALQGEVVSIYPCSSDNTFVYLHKRNQWGDAMVVPSGMSLLMVSCPCRENSYLFKPVSVILLLYTFTKEKDSTSHNLVTALAVILLQQSNCYGTKQLHDHLVYGDPWFGSCSKLLLQAEFSVNTRSNRICSWVYLGF